MIKTTEIRQMFIDFFCSKGHKVLPGSSLIPKNDTSLLFTNAGMNQFKNIFLNLVEIPYKRVVTIQKCIRAGGKHNDLEQVGYTPYHHTFFEMLGNFSFGDYFKYDAIKFAWELLTSTKWFNLPKEKLWITVYHSDYETYNIWLNELKNQISSKHIILVGDINNINYLSDNFWQMSDIGPCGPCSEIYYNDNNILNDFSNNFKINNSNYTEIWNLVFMQFNRQLDGTLLPLKKPLVDTGMGLERITAILQNVDSNYKIDLFEKLIFIIQNTVQITNFNINSLNIIADHIRACVFLIGDGVLPSNIGRGYVLRKIIRRTIRHANILGINTIFLYKLVSPLIELMGSIAFYLKNKLNTIKEILFKEEKLFFYTLKRGLDILKTQLFKTEKKILDGKIAFHLYDTYGFPLDLTIEICKDLNIIVDKTKFQILMKEQKDKGKYYNKLSVNYSANNQIISTKFLGYEHFQCNSYVTNLIVNDQKVNSICQNELSIVILDQTCFYAEAGGQIGDNGYLKFKNGIFAVMYTKKYGEFIGHFGKLIYGFLKIGAKVFCKINIKFRKKISLNHSASHLLHITLRKVLGKHVVQKGLMLNDQRLRFDFFYKRKLCTNQILRIENIINRNIKKNLPIIINNIDINSVSKKKIISLFQDRYSSAIVRVVRIGNFSTEACCGTHTKYTNNIKIFKIISNSIIAANISRIEALTGKEAFNFIFNQDKLLRDITKLVKCNKNELLNKIKFLQEEFSIIEKKNKFLKKKIILKEINFLLNNKITIKTIDIIISKLIDYKPKILRNIINDIITKLNQSIIILASIVNHKIFLIVKISKKLTNIFKANDIIKDIIQKMNGKGGGSECTAEAYSNNTPELSTLLNEIRKTICIKLKTFNFILQT